jgi:hypothetical protein
MVKFKEATPVTGHGGLQSYHAEEVTLSRHLVHRLRSGQPHAPAKIYSPDFFIIIISVSG